jgi:hypothetical protein
MMQLAPMTALLDLPITRQHPTRSAKKTAPFCGYHFHDFRMVQSAEGFAMVQTCLRKVFR